MENMQYAEAVVKEFLLFRGFTHSLHAFDAEVDADVGHGFQVDRIVDLLFTVYVPRFEADNLTKLMAFLQQSFLSLADARYHSTFRNLEVALKKYYIVNAVQRGRPDQLIHFFERHGDSLLRNGSGDDWQGWFALPYMKFPSADPRFQVYFSKEWLDTLIASFSNFLSEVFDSIRLPVLLRLHSERMKSRAFKEELENVRAESKKLQSIIQAQEDEISKLKREFVLLHSDSQSGESSTKAEGHICNQGSFNYLHPSSQSSAKEGEGLLAASPLATGKCVLKAGQEQGSELIDVDVSASSDDSSSRAPSQSFPNGEPIDDTTSSWSKEEEILHVEVKSQVGWIPSLAIQALLLCADSPMLDQTLQVLQLTGLSGSGQQIILHQQPIMQLSTVESRSWPWNGRKSITGCCC